jgi:parallel beta-helix repeat protein
VPEIIPDPEQHPEIRITSSEEWKDTTIIIDSYLTINSGCSLTLTNVNLQLGSEGHAVMLYIESGGELKIYNSTISDTENGYGGIFMAAKGSHFVLKDSRWLGTICMWWNDGFFNYADNITIDNCFLQRVNIKLIGTSGARIVNNTIEDAVSPISLCSSSDSIIENNTIRNCIGTAIGLGGSYSGGNGGSNNNSVQNNFVSDSWCNGIFVNTGSGNIVSYNHIEHISLTSIWVVEDNNVAKDNIIK